MRFTATVRTLILSLAPLCGFAGVASALTCDPPPLSGANTWLPVTSAPTFAKPAPHPAPDCPFYQAAWQQFLYDTQSDLQGVPAFVRFPSVDDIFAPPGAATMVDGDAQLKINAGVNQVTSDGVLIDRDGYPVFYGIHVNPAFADFIHRHDLATPEGILAPSGSALTFPAGVAEYKSAWRVLTDPAQYADYLTVRARVPKLSVMNGRVSADPTSTYVATVGLVGLHVVFAIEGHPEMIWATFEHVDRNGNADLTPQALVNPQLDTKPLLISPNVEYVLFRRGSAPFIDQAAPALADYAASLDVEGRRFVRDDAPFTTPVYRVYPGSNMTRSSEDDEVLLLNAGVRAEMLADGLGNSDRRINYRLVGATWLDRPETSFTTDASFANAPDQTTKTGPVAGQDALSSVAMESFTQVDRPGCFSCHDTQAIAVSPKTSIPARPLNMSHLFSHYLQSLGE
jgi:hypothetical protein